MVKPGYAQAPDAPTRGELRQASEVVDQVRAGSAVGSDLLNRAGQALVGALWQGQGAQTAAAQSGLAELIISSGDAAGRARLLGEVVAAGAVGQPVLDALVGQPGGPTSVAGLSAEQIGQLRQALTQSPGDRLETVVDMMQAERSAPTADRPTDEPVEQPRDDALVGPDPESILRNRNADPSDRFDAAMAMGSAAIPLLGVMLRDDRIEREVAAAALAQLGINRQTARAVHDQIKQLEGDPETRPAAEHIRRGVEGGDNAWAANQRHLTDQANIGDGWLGRAIDACDRPSILRAAAGREVCAISLAVRRLASMRASRTSGDDC